MFHLPPSRSTALWQMDAQIKTEMSVIFLREIHVDAVKLIFAQWTLLRMLFFFPSHIFQPCEMSTWQPQSLLCQWTSKWGWKKDDSSEEEEREKCLHHLCWRAMPCLHKKQAVRWRSIWFHCSSSGCICELYWSCTTERGEEGQIEKILSHYLSFVRHIYTQHKFGLLSNISKNTKLSNLFLLKPGNSNKHQSYYSRNPRPWGFPPNVLKSAVEHCE